MRQQLESKLLFAAPAELLLAEPASNETRRLLEHIGEQLGVSPRLEGASAGKYCSADAALAAVEAFYSSGRSSGSSGSASGSAAHATAALEAVRALPPLVQRALAHLLDHLRPFGLQAVLRLGSSFQEWAAAQEMRLSANTLRWVPAVPPALGLACCPPALWACLLLGGLLEGVPVGAPSLGVHAIPLPPISHACAASWRYSRTAPTADPRAA